MKDFQECSAAKGLSGKHRRSRSRDPESTWYCGRFGGRRARRRSVDQWDEEDKGDNEEGGEDGEKGDSEDSVNEDGDDGENENREDGDDGEQDEDGSGAGEDEDDDYFKPSSDGEQAVAAAKRRVPIKKVTGKKSKAGNTSEPKEGDRGKSNAAQGQRDKGESGRHQGQGGGLDSSPTKKRAI